MKPKKIRPHTYASENTDEYITYCNGYNQCCDDYEAYLNELIEETSLQEIWHKETKEDITLSVARGIKAICKYLKGEL